MAQKSGQKKNSNPENLIFFSKRNRQWVSSTFVDCLRGWWSNPGAAQSVGAVARTRFRFAGGLSTLVAGPVPGWRVLDAPGPSRDAKI